MCILIHTHIHTDRQQTCCTFMYALFSLLTVVFFVFVKDMQTPLHIALLKPNNEIAMLLISHGADMEKKDKVSSLYIKNL